MFLIIFYTILFLTIFILSSKNAFNEKCRMFKHTLCIKLTYIWSFFSNSCHDVSDVSFFTQVFDALWHEYVVSKSNCFKINILQWISDIHSYLSQLFKFYVTENW